PNQPAGLRGSPAVPANWTRPAAEPRAAPDRGSRCSLRPVSADVGPHAYERYHLLLGRAVYGWCPGLAIHFWKGARRMVGCENHHAAGQSRSVLVCGGCSGCHPLGFSAYGKNMARPVAKTRCSGCAAARGTFAWRVRPNKALQCGRPAATSRRLGSLARFARLTAPERQRWTDRITREV